MYYEEKWIDGKLCWRSSPDGEWTAYTAYELGHRYQAELKRASDHQQTVERLERRVQELEAQHEDMVTRNKILRDRPDLPPDRAEWHDGFVKMQQQVTDLQAQLAVARIEIANRAHCEQGLAKTRDELQQQVAQLRERVKFLGATEQPDGMIHLDMKKYHAAHRCEVHREDPWQGIDVEVDCFVCLKERLNEYRTAHTTLLGLVRELMETWVNGRKVCDGIPLSFRE